LLWDFQTKRGERNPRCNPSPHTFSFTLRSYCLSLLTEHGIDIISFSCNCKLKLTFTHLLLWIDQSLYPRLFHLQGKRINQMVSCVI